MAGAKKTVILGLVATGVALAVLGRLADDASIPAMLAPTFGILCFIAAGVLALVPDRAAEAEPEPTHRRPVPRTLARDVLNDPALGLPLAERVAQAIELSKAESRLFGVVCLRVPIPARTTKAHETALTTSMQAGLAAVTRALRPTDRAIAGERGEVLLFLPLLAERKDLESVAARMQRAAQKIFAAEAGEPAAASARLPRTLAVVDAGTALYPLDGYDADDLIASARKACRAGHARRIGRTVGTALRLPALASGAPDELAPLPPLRKPRVRRVAGSTQIDG